MDQSIKLRYGVAQPLLSGKMAAFPILSKWVNKIFGYTNIGNYARSLVFRRQISRLNLGEMKSIIDLGCGYGEYSFMMSRALPHANITAVDIDHDALQNVRHAQDKLQLPNLTIHEGFLSELNQQDVDLIYSVDVFEHIPEDKMPFSEANRKLKSGGYLMVKMPNIRQSAVFPTKWFDEHNKWLDHEHPGQVYSLEDLKRRFEEEGFSVVYAEQTDGILSRLAWELAYLMKKGGPILQLLSLPFCKILVRLDSKFSGNYNEQGNAITVIGQKP